MICNYTLTVGKEEWTEEGLERESGRERRRERESKRSKDRKITEGNGGGRRQKRRQAHNT